MKKIVFLMFVCFFVAGSGIAGYCQDSDIEQSESAIGQNLESEIASDQAKAENDVDQVQESMDSGGQSNY